MIQTYCSLNCDVIVLTRKGLFQDCANPEWCVKTISEDIDFHTLVQIILITVYSPLVHWCIHGTRTSTPPIHFGKRKHIAPLDLAVALPLTDRTNNQTQKLQ